MCTVPSWFENSSTGLTRESTAQPFPIYREETTGKEWSKPFYDHGSLVEPADWRDGNDPHEA
jgi:hypothetical protein